MQMCMRYNSRMARSTSSSIRVSSQTRRRVSHIARRLHASSQQDVIDRALDALEHRLFWEGFDGEAKAYLEQYPHEMLERRKFGQVSGDGLQPR